ncbi:hypothetical protein VTI74DRAFT_5523 [Chaetomium olivicolor]
MAQSQPSHGGVLHGGPPYGGFAFGYGLDTFGADFDDQSVPPPPPAGGELLSENEQQLMQNLCGQAGPNGDALGLFAEGLPLLHTDNWISHTDVVGHNVSYGPVPERVLESVFPDLAAIGMLSQESLPFGQASNLTSPTSTAQQFQQSYPYHRPHQFQQPHQFHQPQQLQHSFADQHPHDVLAAATALSRGNAAQFGIVFDQSRASAPAQHQTAGPSGNAAHQLPTRNGSNSLGEMLFDALSRPETYAPRATQPVNEVQFGSDPNFNRANFVPRSERETTNALQAAQLATLGCLERNVSAAPTRAPSPTSWSPTGQEDARRRSSVLSPVRLRTATHNPLTPDEPENGDVGPARKRRKSNRTDEPDGENGLATAPRRPSLTTALPRRRKQPSPLTPEADANAPPGATKIRQNGSSITTTKKASGAKGKGAAAGNKPRGNLTEEQKRENHIRSERKRREAIKDGFDSLTSYVVPLKHTSVSKAAQLDIAFEWMLELRKHNTELLQMLRDTDPDPVRFDVAEYNRARLVPPWLHTPPAGAEVGLGRVA